MGKEVEANQRIAFFLPALYGGGAERVMLNLARGFAARGMIVDLVLAKAEGAYLSQVPSSVQLVDLKASRVLTSLPGLVRYLRTEQPNALVSTLSHANIVALWAVRLAHVPMRIVVREAATIGPCMEATKSIGMSRMVKLMSYCYPWADRIVAVSNGVADDLVGTVGLCRDRIRVIYNPVVGPEIVERAKEPVVHPWFEPGGYPVILGVGRLRQQKDFSTLIEAFARVRSQRPARLVILGEGEERPELEALVEDLGMQNDVLLPGFVDNPYAYMARAAAFVLSSKWEGFGNVLVEAMTVGTQVVSTDCLSGPREILEGGKWGKLVPVGDVSRLASAIITVLDDPAHPNVTQRARDFGIDRALDSYAELLFGG